MVPLFYVLPFFGTCLCLLICIHGFEVRELSSPDFAAEVIGIQLPAISSEEFDELHQFLLTYKVLIIRNQSSLSVEDQRTFTQKFGPLHAHLESTSHLPGYSDVNVISNIRNISGGATGLYGEHVENFHTDLSWSHLPTKITFLRSEILPSEGGDTHFADSTQAYKTLPSSLKERLNGLKGHYSYLKFRDHIPGIVGDDEEYVKRGQVHPLVITHPITGEKSIYANPGHTASIEGLPDDESHDLLQILFDAVAKPEHIYVHKWSEGDALMWDNRALQHKATPAPSSPRRLIRTTVLNDDIPRENIEESISFSRKTCTLSTLSI